MPEEIYTDSPLAYLGGFVGNDERGPNVDTIQDEEWVRRKQLSNERQEYYKDRDFRIEDVPNEIVDEVIWNYLTDEIVLDTFHDWDGREDDLYEWMFLMDLENPKAQEIIDSVDIDMDYFEQRMKDLDLNEDVPDRMKRLYGKEENTKPVAPRVGKTKDIKKRNRPAEIAEPKPGIFGALDISLQDKKGLPGVLGFK